MRQLPATLLLLLLSLTAPGTARAGAPADTSRAAHAPGGSLPPVPDSLLALPDSLRPPIDSSAAAVQDTNPFAPPPRDPTHAAFHYVTNYSVNRNLANWSQQLLVDTYWHSIHIDNKTDVNFREDTERHARSGQRTTDLRMNYLGTHGASAGFNLELERNNDGPIVNGKLRPTSTFNNTAARLALGDSIYLLSQPLTLNLEGGGVSHDENSSERRVTSGRDFKQSLNWTFLNIRHVQFQVTENNAAARTTGALGAGGRDTSFHSHDFDVGTQTKFSVPWQSLVMTLNASHAESNHEQPTAGQLEQIQQRTESADGNINMVLLGWGSLVLNGRANRNLVTSSQELTRNYAARSKGVTGTLVYFVPYVGNFSSSLGDQLSENVRNLTVSRVDSQTIEERNLVTTYTRDLGPDFNTQVNLAAILRRTRYGDSRQDQDNLNRRIGGTLNFQKTNFPITLTFQASQVLNHTVFLNSSKSGQSSTDELYSIEYDVAYHHGAGLTVTQSYIVSADANISDFETNPFVTPNNVYIKSTNYLTSIKESITPRTSVEMAHNLRLSRSGSYDLDESGNRVFGESNAGQNNDLTLLVNYRFASWLTGVATNHAQYIQQNSLDQKANKVPLNRQRILEFNAGITVNYPFSETASLTGNFSRSARSDKFTPYTSGNEGRPRLTNQDFFLISSRLDLRFY